MPEADQSDFPVTLPEIPGDWDEQTFEIAGQSLRIRLPGKPDLFLDDPQVIAANQQNDYMPYWSYLWPAAPPMARAVMNAPWPEGSRVLELGAGIGLVGLICMLRGDVVTFSDYDATSLKLCQVNAQLNALPCPRTLNFDWRNHNVTEGYPVIIGCEVTYDANQHEPLLDVITRLLLPGGTCWLGDPGRYQAPLFYQRARSRGFQVRVLDEKGTEHAAPLSNSFQIMELKLAK